MNILIITNLYPLPWEPNRAAFNRQQFDRLSKNHNVRVLVPIAWKDYWANRDSITRLKTNKIKYVCYWYTPKFMYAYFGVFMTISIWLSSKKWVLKESVDLVIGSWAYPDGYAAMKISKFLDVPYVIKVHGSDINLLETGSKKEKVVKEVCLNAKKVISVSNALKEKIVSLGICRDKVVTIYNGVDHSLFFPEERKLDDDQSQYFLFVGNLKQSKGVLDLLKAYIEYRNQGGVKQLVYIGGGPMLTKLKQLSRKSKFEKDICYLGSLNHEVTADKIKKCYSLVLPSYNEGVPNVLLEAISCGIPVIATKVGGIPEVISPLTGLLIEPGQVDQLRTALFKMEEQSNFDRAKIADAGMRYSWVRNIAQVENVFIVEPQNESKDIEGIH